MSKTTCYYAILEVDKEAGDNELKKAYRKLALQLHPDKHSEEDRDEATRKFALLQHAYEVLSNPQERAWYDSHRDSILSNSSKSSTPGDGGLSTDDIKRYFSRGVYNTFDDSEKGFFTIFRTLFQSLAKNEQYDLVPQFGSSDQEYIEDEVKSFYDFWLSFSSTRSFSWHDIYKPSDAPDRRMRRLMEKDNAKLRELAKKEFNSTLRCLVEYVQKRDPRYKKHMEERSAEKEKATQKRIAAQKLKKDNNSKSTSNFQLPSWAQVDEEELEEIENLDDWSYTNLANPSVNNDGFAEDDSASEIIEGLDLYCPACDKFFETLKQQQHHNETKKHLKMVERLRAQLLEEEKEIYSDSVKKDSFTDSKADYSTSQQTTELPNSSGFLDHFDVKVEYLDSSLACKLDDLHLSELGLTKKSKKQKQKKKNVINTFYLLEEQEDPSLLQHLDKHDSKKSPQNTNDIDCIDNTKDISRISNYAPFGTLDPEVQDTANMLKKSKREKRKAKNSKALANQLSCNVCNELFDTRNQLFSHIRVTGHAQASQ